LEKIPDILRLHIVSGEPLTLAYAYGRQQGEARSVIVLGFDDSGKAVRIRELVDNEEEKHFHVGRILWVKHNGRRFENEETLRRYNDYISAVSRTNCNIELVNQIGS